MHIRILSGRLSLIAVLLQIGIAGYGDTSTELSVHTLGARGANSYVVAGIQQSRTSPSSIQKPATNPTSAQQPTSPSSTDPCNSPNPVLILAAIKVRDQGEPTATDYPFIAATPLPVCIAVTNGGKPRGGEGTSSGVVTLDSTVLLSQHDFSPRFAGAKLKRPLSAGSHLLSVDLASAPGTFIKVVISTPAVEGRPVVILPDHHDTSPPLGSMPQLPPPTEPVIMDPAPSAPIVVSGVPDPVLQTTPSPGTSSADFAVINGIPLAGGYPPDPNASIGGNQVVETVNRAFQVFNKSSGQSLLGPSGLSTIWQGFGGFCQTSGFGDPVVHYDNAAGRWFITQLATDFSTVFGECIAVSTSSDATGSYNRYSYAFSSTPDYPKVGIWPDAYYLSYNNPSNWACAYDRGAMLSGAKAQTVCFPKPAGELVALPSDLDGTAAPPSGEPNFYVGWPGSTSSLDLFRFHVDFTTTGNSTFNGPTSISVAPFSASQTFVPQLGTSQTLPSDMGTLKNRLTYRNFGSHESLVTCHIVDSGSGGSAVRWYEIRSPSTTPTVYQQGSYAPDSSFRFYCGAAMDGAGNIAVGYSVSSSAMYPAIRLAGRFATDPLGVLRAETSIIEGGGYQAGTNRWGDYTSMAIDASDDMTFVYTNEYYAAPGGNGMSTGWSTRMATFTLNPFGATGSLGTPRFLPAVTLLPSGKVLVAGGSNSTGAFNNAISTAELYDPATGSFTATGSMTTPRAEPQGILLPNGKVLVAGGYDTSGGVLASAELYDPVTGTFTAIGSMTVKRVAFAATLLPNGKVLIAGGSSSGVPSGNLASAELYDLTTGTFTATGSMTTSRTTYTAALLPNGKVLIAGGQSSTIGVMLASAELYDPSTGAFSVTGSMTTPRFAYTETLLPNGKVLIAGGTTNGDNTGTLASAELYDPTSGAFALTGSLNTGRFISSSAPLLPNGNVFITGGRDSMANIIESAEIYNSATGTFSYAGTGMSSPHFRATEVLLANGKVLIAGGDDNTAKPVSAAELYDSGYPQTVEAFTSKGSMTTARGFYAETQLPNGSVLIAGGSNGSTALSSAELYNPGTGAFTATGSMSVGRVRPSAVLLPNGLVLIAGGQTLSGTPLGSADLYDPVAGTFTPTGSMSTGRYAPTMTLLPTGEVLVAGGQGPTGSLATAELYDPASGTFASTASMATARAGARAVLLSVNGKVLIGGGVASNGKELASAELYDPWAGTFVSTGSMGTARGGFTGVLLPNGSVLIAGGQSSGTAYLSSAEIYNPVAGTFAATGSMSQSRSGHSASLLPNGKVLVAGGFNGSSALVAAELYDPATGAFVPTGAMLAARFFQQSIVLRATGNLLMPGGFNGAAYLASAELYQ